MNGVRYFFLFGLLAFGSLGLSESSNGAFGTGGEDAATRRQVVNPFGLNSSEANVCTRTSLDLAINYLTENELVDTCDSIYRPTTCCSLSSGEISAGDLHLRVETYECCDGFLKDGNSCSRACPPLAYGPNCSLSCSCLNDGVCSPIDGSCDCRPGWMGRHCEQTCPDGRFGDGCADTCQCRNNGSCHSVTGDCLCRHNFAGEFCQIDCQDAPGDSLCRDDAICSLCHEEGSNFCDFVFGACRCADGWWGRYCSHTCERHSYGMRCKETCQCVNSVSCLPRNGSCICQPGWTGEKCDRKCPLGFHGDGCQKRCSCPGNDGGCDHVTGSCQSCPSGWMGQLCTLPCEEDHWGENCSRDCNCAESLNCDPVSGACFNVEGCDMELATRASSDEPATAGLGPGLIAAIVGSAAGLFILLAGVVIAVIKWRRQQKPNLPIQHNAYQPNGTVSGRVAAQTTVDQTNERTIRHQIEDRVNFAPAPLPRGPAALRRDADPVENIPESDGYDSLSRDTPDPSSSNAGPHMVIYDEIRDPRTRQVDNPVYTGIDTDGYEVPTRTLVRALQFQKETRNARP